MKSFVISFTFIFISCLGFAQSRQYLLAGQSNARGRGDATLSPTVDPMTSYEYHPSLNILFQLEDPVGVNSGGFQQAATGSAWPAFGKTYYDITGDTTVMIPAARGGSGVHPISASAGANWSANGLLYSLCQFKVDQAMMLTGLPLDGIVWVQGEQDAARITFGAYEQDDYRDALIELIDRFRGDYGCAVPFYMVLLGTNTEDPIEGYDAVRAAQVEVAAIHPHTYLIHENAVNFPGMGWMLDNVHYTQDGYNEIGVVGATNVVDIERTYYRVSASISTTDTICPGDSVMLSAPSMYVDYQWSTGDTGQNIFVTEGGEYTVTVTDPSGCAFPLCSTKICAYADQIRPTISLSANDTLCVGDMLTLTASPTGQNFLWSTGATTSSITLDDEGDFFVQTIDTNGCLSQPSDTISTTVISLSIPIITSNNSSSTICEGDTVVLSAPPGFDTYLWSNGETTQSIAVTTSGSFSSTVGLADCLSEPSAPFTITVIPTPPPPTITWDGPTTFCEGDSVTLTASAELDRYMWSTGDTTQSITVYNSGIYSCIFIGENDCIGESSLVFVTENLLPETPSITVVGNTELCEGDDLILNAPEGFDTYEWSTGESTPSITVSAAGTYDVTVTDSNGCQSAPSAPITTTINALPPAPIITPNNSTTFCEGGSVTLTVPAGFTNYQWSNGESTPSITVYDSNSYFCIVTDANGCVSPISDPINTTAVPAPLAPTITTSSPTTFCEGDSVILSAPFGFSGYQWSNGETTQSITVYDSGTYDVFVVNNSNCESPLSEPITVTSISSDTPPLISINGAATVCEGESVILTAPLGLSGYLWSNGAITQSITVTDSGTFTCIITSADGCESPPSNPIVITVNPQPSTPIITPNNSTTFCEGDEVILSAPSGFMSYLWSNGETTQSITVTDSGTFDVIVIDANGCTSLPSVPVATISNSIQTPSITAQSSTTFCEGESVTLSAPSGFTSYLWSTGETTQSITVTDSDTFDVIVIDANDCESMPSAPIVTTAISTNTAPAITTSGTTTLCEGENVVLTAPSDLSGYLWSTGEITQSITVSTAGTYICIITSPNGCESPPSTPVIVTVNPLPAMPIITSNNANTFCEGGSVTLTAPAGFADYLWSTGETTQSIIVNTSGTFDVMVIDANGCESPISEAITINVNAIPTANITAQSSTTFCEGESVTLTAPSGFSDYLWSTGEITQSITVIGSGTFDVIVTDANDCESIPSAPITTTAISATTAPIITTSGATNICQGENVTLSAPAGFADYLWSNGETTQEIIVNTSDTYSCIITSANGCESPPSAPIDVTINPLPNTPTITPDNATTFCEGESVSLSAPSGFTDYLWSNGETTQSITVTDSGVFDVMITDLNGCMSAPSSSITVTVNSVATPSISTSGATTFCEGESVILSAPSGFQNYLWSNGETTQSITVTDSGTFDVVVTDANGCESPNSMPITVLALSATTPPILTTSGPTSLCEGETVMLSAPAGFTSYLWSNGETTQNIVVNTSGTFTCEITSANGCPSPPSAPITVTVNPPPPAPSITANDDTTFCEGGSVVLSAPSGFSGYLWSNGETTQSITVTDSDTYSVFITDVNGCESSISNTITTTVNSIAIPTVTASGATTFCEGESVMLSAPNGFQNYLWSTGEITQSIIVGDSGDYSVVVTDANGCISPASMPVNVVALSSSAAPEISINGETTICEGESVTLSAPPGLSGYQWSTGDTTQSIIIDNSGTFTCEIIDNSGCVSPASEPVTIVVNSSPPTPTIMANGATTFCEGESVTLSAPSGFINYQWSNGDTTQSITVFNSGDYDVFVTNTSDCISANSAPVNVTVNTLPSTPELIASSATTFCDGDHVVLSAPEGFDTYEWSNGAATQSITVYDSGTFNCFVSDANGCVSSVSDSVDVVVNEAPPIPQLIANGETEFCEGGSVTISAPAGFDNYLWSNGETGQEITVSDEGSYDLTITNAHGCSSASDVSTKVIVHPLPAEPIVQAVGAPVFCEGDNVTLVVSGGFNTYLWSTGETTQDIIVSETGAFYCTVTDINGCENVSAAFSTVENESLPVPEITFSGETEFCEGGSVTLFAPSGYSYLWSNGATTQDITITETSGPLSCVIMDTNGCMSEASDETFVKVFPLPPVPTIDTVGLTTLCLGNTVELVAPDGFDSYMWSNGEITQSITVGVSGNYSVAVLNEDGCASENATPVNITVNATPLQPTISVGGSTNFCEGESVTLSAPPDAPGYLWSNGETTQSITVTETGSFYCIVLDEFDCQSQASVTVSTTVFDLPDTPLISLSDDAILCPGDTVILSAEPGFATYSWSNGAVSEKIIATTDGEYSYIVLDDNGCESTPSETVTIEVRPLPPPANIHSSNDFNFCEGDSIRLEADSGFLSYLWSTGETDSIISVNRADEFFYVADDGFSCEDVVSVSVMTGINPPPPMSAIEQIGIDTLCASQNADRYIWYRNDTLTNFTTRCIAPELSGDWQVIGIVDNCLSEFSTAYEYTGRDIIDPDDPSGINVFPNPAVGGIITIQTINIPEGRAILDIYDVLGRLLYRRELDIPNSPAYEYTIDIERLPDAVYVAVIDAGFSGRFAQKFVVDD